jgi:hypothetical protein
MNIVVIYFVLVGVTVLGTVATLVIGWRAGSLRWPLFIFAVFVIGAIWQEAALRTFAARETSGMSGLILRPVPYGGGDHDFAPRGAHYAKWAFVIPCMVTTATALLGCLGAVAVSGSHVAGQVAGAFITGTLGLVLVAVARLIAASEIFI